MALGGQSLGLRAKVEAEMDRQASRKLTREVEQAIEQAESSVSPSADGSFRGRTTPGGGGGTGGVVGGAAAGGAARSGALSSLAKGGTAAGGAAVLGTVFLGGVVATKMLQKMQQASGELQASTSMLGTAMDLFFKPFGDYLGSLLMPLSKSLLKTSVGLNKNISENGLIIGGMQSLLDFVNNLPGEIGKIFVQTMGQRLEGLFGEHELFTELQEFQWSDWIPIVKWDDFLSGAFDMVSDEWPGWPAIKTDWPGWPDIPDDPFGGLNNSIGSTEDALDGLVDWVNNTIPGVNIDTGGGGDGGSDGSGGGGGAGDRGETITRDELTTRERKLFSGADGGGSSGGDGFNPDLNPFRSGNQDAGDIVVQLEADGRRLFDTTQRGANDLLNRL